MSPLIAIASGLLCGVLHATAPDHLAALLSLLAGRSSRRAAVQTALRFGLGHGLTLAALALGAMTAGWMIPPAFERVAEWVGGGLLVALGTALAWRGTNPAANASPGRAWWIGGAFAFSGIRGLLLVLPPLVVSARSMTGAALYVAAFGAGLAGAMLAFGWFYGAFKTAIRGRVKSWAATLFPRFIGAFVAILGVCWIVAYAAS